MVVFMVAIIGEWSEVRSRLCVTYFVKREFDETTEIEKAECQWKTQISIGK